MNGAIEFAFVARCGMQMLNANPYHKGTRLQSSIAIGAFRPPPPAPCAFQWEGRGPKKQPLKNQATKCSTTNETRERERERGREEER